MPTYTVFQRHDRFQVDIATTLVRTRRDLSDPPAKASSGELERVFACRTTPHATPKMPPMTAPVMRHRPRGPHSEVLRDQRSEASHSQMEAYLCSPQAASSTLPQMRKVTSFCSLSHSPLLPLLRLKLHASKNTFK